MVDDLQTPFTANQGPDPRPQTGVSARTVWYVVGVVTFVGIAVLLGLTYMWRTGRVRGVSNVSFPQPRQIAAYGGSFPAGGKAPLRAPRSVSVEGTRLYVTEPDAARVSVFDLQGRFIRALDVRAAGTVYAVDAVSIGDSLYVADTAGNRLLAMPVNGGGAHAIAPSLRRPTALAVDHGDLIIADASSGLWRMKVGTSKLTRIAAIEATRGFTGGIAVGNGRLFVSDAGGSRILDVALPGGDVGAFGERIDLPRGVALDSDERVWAADVFGGTVKVFSPAGELLGDLEDGETTGAETANIVSPEGVAYSRATGTLYVVDSGAGRVLAYGIER